MNGPFLPRAVTVNGIPWYPGDVPYGPTGRCVRCGHGWGGHRLAVQPDGYSCTTFDESAQGALFERNLFLLTGRTRACREQEGRPHFMEAGAEHFAAYVVETTCGTEVVPENVCGKVTKPSDVDHHVEGKILRKQWPPKLVKGWWANLSAPGYLDQTGWTGPHATAEEALAALAEEQDLCEHCSQRCWELDGGQEPPSLLGGAS